jgi:hypothetical protein
VQFTADLMPSDLLGVSVYERGSESFVFHPGPVFAQVLLADEINRASPKTQSALLEAMEEKQVTVEGATRPLPQPFFVIATQNPHDQLGTYALPESQLDRFLMRISLGYPERRAERELLAGEGRRERADALRAVLSALELAALQQAVGRARGRSAAGLRAGPDRRHALGPLVRAGPVAARRHRAAARGARPGADRRARLRGPRRRAGRAARLHRAPPGARGQAGRGAVEQVRAMIDAVPWLDNPTAGRRGRQDAQRTQRFNDCGVSAEPAGCATGAWSVHERIQECLFCVLCESFAPLRPVFRIGIKTIAAPASLVPANALFNPESAAAPALPWWAARARARQRWARWWQARQPRTDTLLLTQRNVYILPTRAGWMLAATLVVLLIGSINFQLNLGYALTFLLAGCAAAGMVIGHNTLRGLALQLAPPEPVFAGQRRACRSRWSTAGARRAWPSAWRCAARASGPGPTCRRAARRRWKWPLRPRRGQHAVPALVAETRFPLGSFRVWAPWQPAARVLVYPAPEPQPPALPVGEPAPGSGATSGARASGEFDGVRAYQRGDPLKLVVWKKYARSGELVSRDTQQVQRHALWLDFARAGALGAEARLSRLAAWVLAADAQQLDYGLRLPGVEIAPDSGPAHRLRCLQALATC